MIAEWDPKSFCIKQAWLRLTKNGGVAHHQLQYMGKTRRLPEGKFTFLNNTNFNKLCARVHYSVFVCCSWTGCTSVLLFWRFAAGSSLALAPASVSHCLHRLITVLPCLFGCAAFHIILVDKMNITRTSLSFLGTSVLCRYVLFSPDSQVTHARAQQLL